MGGRAGDGPGADVEALCQRRNLRANVWWVRVEGGMRMIAARCALRGEKLVDLWEDCWVHGAFGLS